MLDNNSLSHCLFLTYANSCGTIHRYEYSPRVKYRRNFIVLSDQAQYLNFVLFFVEAVEKYITVQYYWPEWEQIIRKS